MSKPEPTLDDIAQAMREVDGQTPTAVIEAFIPKAVTKLGKTLVPLTAGHELALSQLGHPLATGKPWEDVDVLMALFIFCRPSREVFAMIADGSFESQFFLFIDGIPTADIAKLGTDMIAHWMRSRATSLAMENPHATSQKKTADSDGCLTLSQRLAQSMAGCRKWLSMTFRSASCSL